MSALATPPQAALRTADTVCIHMIGGAAPLDTRMSTEILGFKAYNLARMAALGLRVPAAFVLGTGFCAQPGRVVPALWCDALVELQQLTGLTLGDPRRPLLLSVRSGAAVSMPGMMDTLLNIGLCDATLPGLLRLTGHPRLTWDAYRRLIAGYGEIVAGIEPRHFEADLAEIAKGEAERALDFTALREIARRHLETYRKQAGEAFPQDPQAQLAEAIRAVFRSWDSDKARTYRNLHGLPHDMGTAVTVQRMVFGNAGGLSGAGVGFTRNPSDGAPDPWVDFLFNAQGEDVVSGRRTAQGHDQLAAVVPDVWAELVGAARLLEHSFGDMQDIEFTVERGQLFMLQTRTGKRTPRAAARIALDLLDEGVIDADTARERTRDLNAAALTVMTVAPEDGGTLAPLAMAASAASGVVSGEIALTETEVHARKAAGARIILVRRDAETRDIAALELADGLLTQHGARTSHAAVVARQMGKVCLVGCEQMRVDEEAGHIEIGGRTLEPGAMLTLDGNEGRVFAGTVRLVPDIPQALLARLKTLRGAA